MFLGIEGDFTRGSRAVLGERRQRTRKIYLDLGLQPFIRWSVSATGNFLWRCALAFSPRGLDHAKRRCRDRVAPYFFVTVSIHYMQ